MLLPFETSFSIWFAGTPQYDYEPLPAPDAPAADAAPTDAAPGDACGPGASATPPLMRLVFKGVAWTAQQVCWSQANPAWEVCTGNARSQDEDRGLERAKEARRLPPTRAEAGLSDLPPAGPDPSR